MPPRSTTTSGARRPKPAGKINGLNLDTLQREGEAPEPYTFAFQGRPFVIENPDELPWQDVAAVDPRKLVPVLRQLLGAEQFPEFAKHPLPTWKIRQLIQSVYAHFGITEEAQGEEDALPPS